MRELRRFWTEEARRYARLFAHRLRAGRGVGGRSLRRKERPDGQPLGGRIPHDLLRGAIFASVNGFMLSYSRFPHIGYFHRGRRSHGQPPRPIVGITKAERAESLKRARRVVARAINRRLGTA